MLPYISLSLVLISCSLQTAKKAKPFVENGDTVFLHFLFMHQNGERFDESEHTMHQDADRAVYPLRIVAGRGDIIKGVDKIVIGMKEGDSILASIPPNDAYGMRGTPNNILPMETVLVKLKITEIDKYVPKNIRAR